MKVGVPMTLTLELSPAEEAKLLQKAEEKGVPVERMLRDVALGIIEEPVRKHRLDPNSEDPFERDIAALQHLIPKGAGSISEESLRRENLYADED
jgi:hypothetical protein